MSGSEISVVVPTYNEASNVPLLIDSIARALVGFDWEVIFVDDNSPDGTADVVHKLSQKSERVRLVLRLVDRGLAKATIQGLLSAKGDLLCVMDGDGQHDPDTALALIASVRACNVDIASAARHLDDQLDSTALSPFRRSLSQLGNRLSSLILKRQVIDPLTGFFVIRREAFLRVAPSLRDPGFKLLLDILSSDTSLQHKEVPFSFGKRLSGESKLDSFVAWQFATFLVSKLSGGILPANLISFLVVGSSGVLVHLAVLYVILVATGSFMLSQVIAVLAAITSNYLLNNLLTFRDKRLSGTRLATGYLKFLLISSIGMAANVSLATFTYERAGQVAALAALAGIALDTLWKFVVSNRLVWR